MNSFKKSKQLRLEAERLLIHHGINETLSAYSDVFYTGSYALDLMAWPDIDIEISLLNDPYNKEAFLEIGKKIGQLQDIISMKFSDHYHFPVEPLPHGLYWNIRIANSIWDVPWKIDLWALKPEEIQKHKKDMQATNQALNHSNRKLIIEIKTSLLNNEGRTPILSGYHIYQAVLVHGLQKRNEVIGYLLQKGVQL